MKTAGFMLFVALWLTGCASSSLVVGTRRPPISPDQVRIYVDPPQKYEKVAVLSAVSNFSFAITEQGKTNKVAERLKAEAAALGANGVLIGGIDDQMTGTWGTGQAWGNAGGAFAIGGSSAIYRKKGQGFAIYVPDDVEAGPKWETNVPLPPPPTPAQSAPRPSVAPAPYQPRELDPAKRCDACQHLNDHI